MKRTTGGLGCVAATPSFQRKNLATPDAGPGNVRIVNIWQIWQVWARQTLEMLNPGCTRALPVHVHACTPTPHVRCLSARLGPKSSVGSGASSEEEGQCSGYRI